LLRDMPTAFLSTLVGQNDMEAVAVIPALRLVDAPVEALEGWARGSFCVFLEEKLPWGHDRHRHPPVQSGILHAVQVIGRFHPDSPEDDVTASICREFEHYGPL
jgi:hypothetical protein